MNAAMRAESLLSVVRISFCALVGARLLWVHVNEASPNAEARIGLSLFGITAAMAMSAWILIRARRSSASLPVLHTSVLLDTLGCSLAIGSNVIAPWDDYRGILMLPETGAAFIAMVVAAGFRVLPRLALLGAISNTLALCSLALADRWLNATLVEYAADQVSIYVVLVLGTATLAYLNARRTAQLVVDAAAEARDSLRAKSSLTHLLQGHHDAVGLLSAALFGVGRLRKRSGSDDAALDELQTDLTRLKEAVDGIRNQALSDVLTLEDVQPVALKPELSQHSATFERAVSPMKLEWTWPTTDVAAHVAGGGRALRRALLNLLVNAQQGNGITGARVASVEVSTEGPHLTLSVQDDGPGMHAHGETTKAKGSGLGLRFVRALAEASGGTFVLENVGAGARARLTLRVSSTPTLAPIDE